ncbi:MAG TPA: efflux RND transporter periplasmic adaptor subunit [Steroidobacteraceae bacterium]|nr:efflux RND transporter periplasmic adaptor subunit [Steroidobacteraceae bacterium]
MSARMIRSSFRFSLLLSAAIVSACGGKPADQAPPPTEVTVKSVTKDPLPLDLTYTARAVGSREVEVRARVSGILLKRRYEEGKPVQQGQPMFLIDPEPIRARLASAKADVAVAQARLDEAQRQRDRILPLFEHNAVSQSRRDEAVSGFEVAQANLTAAESRLRTAELDLEYTDVRAPITGLTSREVLSEGSLVSTDQNSSLLTRIVQVDPLYIEFAVPEAEAALLRTAASGRQSPPPQVKLLLEDGTEFPDAAKLTFVDNAVDTSTGTVRVRAVLQNKEAKLFPGQFLRARVEGVSLGQVVAIPRKAIMSSPQGAIVWIVDGENKVQPRPVQVGRSMGNNVVITDGLAAGDRYVVEGVMKLRAPGTPVNPVSADAGPQQAASPAKAGGEHA